MHSSRAGCLAVLFFVTLLAAPASAQPFDGYLQFFPGYPTSHGYVQIPHHAALNPTAAFTIEAWVLDGRPDSPFEDCRSIAGKGYLQAWWIGICNVGGVHTLRSYLKGDGSAINGGRVAVELPTHVAVTFDGATRRHYINGELVLAVALAGPLTTSPQPVRIGSDVAFERSPTGAIDEVRLWNVARTQAQIRAALNVRVTTPEPGLVAVWPLNGNANDIIGPHDGARLGAGANYLIAPVAANCGESTTTALCLNNRFRVTARYRVGAQGNAEHPAMAIPCGGSPACASSGVWWFFHFTNWELMVKSLNGCAINDYWWLFTAGLTNVYFRMEVTDVTKGETKIYFNYPGPPAPAITDTSAFATCP